MLSKGAGNVALIKLLLYKLYGRTADLTRIVTSKLVKFGISDCYSKVWVSGRAGFILSHAWFAYLQLNKD